MKPHRGAIILVFGILGIVLCQFFGIAAWVMGNRDLRDMSAGDMDPSGRDLSKAGRMLGMVAVGILVLQSIIAAVILLTLALTHR